eukprot:816567-Prorocentrum_minimum.AAC.1
MRLAPKAPNFFNPKKLFSLARPPSSTCPRSLSLRRSSWSRGLPLGGSLHSSCWLFRRPAD